MIEVIWLIVMNGDSTGLVAVHVMIIKVEISVQNRVCVNGRKVIERV